MDTFEQLVLELGNRPVLPTGLQEGSREPTSVEKHLLTTLWSLDNEESIGQIHCNKELDICMCA